MKDNFGINISISLVSNDKGYSLGINYEDSEGFSSSSEAMGDNLNDVINTVFDKIVNDVRTHKHAVENSNDDTQKDEKAIAEEIRALKQEIESMRYDNKILKMREDFLRKENADLTQIVKNYENCKKKNVECDINDKKVKKVKKRDIDTDSPTSIFNFLDILDKL